MDVAPFSFPFARAYFPIRHSGHEGNQARYRDVREHGGFDTAGVVLACVSLRPVLPLVGSCLVTRAHKVYYWSGASSYLARSLDPFHAVLGTALLVLLAWLCCASLTVFRKRYYELFKWLHVLSALLFTAFFFVHW